MIDKKAGRATSTCLQGLVPLSPGPRRSHYARTADERCRPAIWLWPHPDSAYDPPRGGTVDGHVIRISSDAVPDEQTGGSFYLIDVAIEGELVLENGEAVTFIPGMTATVDVLSGKRTVLEYIWASMARVQELALRDQLHSRGLGRK